RVEAIEDARRAKGEDTPLGESRRTTWPGPSLAILVACRIEGRPQRSTAGSVETNHGLLRATLLLREKAIANHGDRRPGRPDSPAPERFRGCGLPIRCDADITQIAVAILAAKSGPIVGPGSEAVPAVDA